MNKQAYRARILLIDDDPANLALAERWLTFEGFEVNAANSGEAALAVLGARRPDVVVTELVMPEIDGIRLLREIHHHDPVIPVIIMSGQASIPEAIKATHLGACAFLSKPIARDALLTEVRQTLTALTGKDAPETERFGPKIVYRSQIMAELLGRAGSNRSRLRKAYSTSAWHRRSFPASAS